jgi:hypothetical protein
VADATQFITHTTASGLNLREIPEAVNIEQHKMLTSARQLWFCHLATRLHRGSGFNRSNSTPGISEVRLRLRVLRELTAAITASDAMKRRTIMISKKGNVPRVNAFKAAAIVTQNSEPTVSVTKRSAISAPLLAGTAIARFAFPSLIHDHVEGQAEKDRPAGFHSGRRAKIRDDGVALFSEQTPIRHNGQSAGNAFFR